MTIGRRLFGAGLALILALTAGSSLAYAQAKKKKKCKDGETEQAVAFKLSKGENLDFQIKESLTGKDGDVASGLELIVHRRLGNCIACHTVEKVLTKAKPDDLESLRTYGFHGKIAPALDGVASRYTEGELRLIVVSPKKAFPDANTIMPSFHDKSGLHQVIGDCKDQVILSAERVEDVVAYLKTLKE